MLTLTQQGLLVCDALYRLPHPEDLAEGIGDRCCPDCCGPCGLLRELLDTGLLDTVVRQGPPHLWRDGVAFMKDGAVDKDWLRACWACTSDPPCELS